MLVSGLLYIGSTPLHWTKVDSKANVCSLSSTDSNPRFETSTKPILDTVALNVTGSCGKFVVSTNENRLGLWKRETGTSTEWSQRLEVHSRQVMENFQKSAFSSKDPAENESKLNEMQPCLTRNIFFMCPMVPDSFALLYALKNSGLPLQSGEQPACFAWNTLHKNWLSTRFWPCCFLIT